jgi:hypothetical protein
MLIRIVYVSHEVRPLSTADLDALLEVSRRNNARLEVTGMLLYHDGDFMQVLEGEEEAVREILRRIMADSRHSGILVLDDTPVPDREFAGWWMGFRRLERGEIPPGFIDFFNRELDAETMARGGDAILFLRSFKRSAR